MTEKLKISAGSNLNQWADALAATNPDVAAVLGENRLAGFEALDALQLPRYQRVDLALKDFMQQPEHVLESLGSDQFYVVAQPTNNSAKRVSKSGLRKEEVPEFINYHISPAEQTSYSAVIQQFFTNLYGGNIIVNSNGKIYAEFKEGKQGPISKGTERPEYFVNRDPYRGIFEYSFGDTELREAVYRTVRAIPHYGSGRHTVYNPGYYEFALVEKTPGALMVPIFFDYRQGRLFEVPN